MPKAVQCNYIDLNVLDRDQYMFSNLVYVLPFDKKNTVFLPMLKGICAFGFSTISGLVVQRSGMNWVPFTKQSSPA